MTSRFWMEWTLLWAFMPVFCAFLFMAANKQVNPEDPQAWLHVWGSWGVGVLALLLYLFSAFAVLRRHLPNYTIWVHTGLVGLVTLIGVALVIAVYAMPFKLSLYLFDGWVRPFTLEVRALQRDPNRDMWAVLGLPWWTLYPPAIGIALWQFALPSLVICRLAGRSRLWPFVFGFIVLGMLAKVTSEAAFGLLLEPRELKIWGLNGRAWSTRWAAIGGWAVSGALAGSISAIGVGALFAQGDRPLRRQVLDGAKRVAVIGAALWGAALCLDYVFGPDGVRTGFADLRKSLSTAPAQEVSTGQDILTFSHLIDGKSFRYNAPNHVFFRPSPDGRYAVIAESARGGAAQFSVFEIASGQRVAKLGAPLASGYRVDVLWGQGQDVLYLRRRGAAVQNGRSTEYETQISSYQLPDFTLIATWSAQGTQEAEGVSCHYGYAAGAGMAEAPDGSLVAVCTAPDATDANKPQAVVLSKGRLEVTSTLPLPPRDAKTRSHGLLALRGGIHILRIGRRGDPLAVLTHVYGGDAPAGGGEHVLDDPLRKDRAGRLTFQGLLPFKGDGAALELRYCGAVDEVSNASDETGVAVQAAWGPAICRVLRYSAEDGAYLGFEDGPETRIAPARGAVKPHALATGRSRVVGYVDPTSKAGDMTVEDGDSGTVLQTLQGQAQVPVAYVEAQGVLVTHRVDARQIAVYRVEPPF